MFAIHFALYFFFAFTAKTAYSIDAPVSHPIITPGHIQGGPVAPKNSQR